MKMKLAVACLISSGVLAHEGATGIIKERMDAMSAIGDANKPLVAMSRGRADFRLETIIDSANTIAEHAGDSLLAMFPEGSTSDVSEAKTEIWEDWSTFSEYASSMESSALTLSQVSSEAEFSEAYRDMSRNCGGCHRSFRAK